MSNLILRSRNTKQPQGATKIAWDNSLTERLGLIATPSGNGFNTELPVTTGGSVIAPSVLGLTAKTPDTVSPGAIFLAATLPVNITGDFTVMLYGVGGGSVSTETAYFTRSGGTLGSTFFAVGGANARVTLDNNAGTAVTTLNPDTPHVIVARRAGNQNQLFIDGVYIGQATTGTRVGTLTGFGFGRSGGSNNAAVNRHDALGAVWSRGLSDDEIKQLSSNPWQLFASKKQVVYFDTGAGSGATLAIDNTLEVVSNSIGFNVSPIVSIIQNLSSVVNSLSFSISPNLNLSNTLDDSLNNLSFSLYSAISLSNTLEHCANTLEFSTPVALALANTLENTYNVLDFLILGSTELEIASTLADTANTISFSVSPKLTISTTLADVLNALDFTVGGANAITLTNTLESILVDLNFEVSPRLALGQTLTDTSNIINFSVSPGLSLTSSLGGVVSTLSFTNELALSIVNILEDITNSINFAVSPRLVLSGTLTDVQNTLSFTGYVNPDIYFETIRLGLKVNTSPSIAMKINLVSNIPLEL